ncbi:MAG: GIY-YIG nuclease family protein [Verrucomicrobiota bacterium]
MDLPEDKGTYILIAQVLQMKRLEIGSLGQFDIVPGFYAYVGSGFGSGGLRGRIYHHLASTAEPHWHIDYLLRVATPVEAWFSTANSKLERRWAELLENAPGFCVPIPRFGSSDYHRSRASHLFYSKRRPSFRWFREQMLEVFEGVEVVQTIIRNCSGVGQTSGLPVHGASGSVNLVRSEHRARGPANRQTRSLPHPPT